jgi:hypothetical protein
MDGTDITNWGAVAAATWFESLAVASHPLQRRPRRNCLLFNHEDHGRHEDWRCAGFADLCRLNKESRMRGALSQFPLFRIEENLCKSGPRESADNNFSASSVSSPAIKPGKIPGLIFAPPGWQKAPHNRATHTHVHVRPRKASRKNTDPDIGRTPAASARRRAFSEFSAGHDCVWRD